MSDDFHVPEERSLSQILESAERSYKSFCETKNIFYKFQYNMHLASMYKKLGEIGSISLVQKPLAEGIAELVTATLKFPYEVSDLYFESLSILVDHFQKEKMPPIETIKRIRKIAGARE